jgi:pseudouridine-5'-phosphate glycosidase
MTMHNYLDIRPEVTAAFENNRPVVALESTIISHGMPYPQNVETARRVETIIREAGAVPATIAVMDGKIKIGLTDDDLERLASSENVVKVSRRDLAAVLARGEIGATTVAATMIAAEQAGIRFFVTGGIGGVHRGFEETLDVSADLEELVRTNVTVICAGAKAILDLPRTMEYLETKGVPVIGMSTDTLPAFYTPDSGIRLPLRVDSPEEAARLINVKDELGLSGGVLIVNPIPKEHAMEAEAVNALIEAALAKAAEKEISGKDVTPFLLAEIVGMSGGRSLEANIALVCHNAAVGAAIALAYVKS